MAKYGPKPLVVDWESFNVLDVAPWACRDCRRSLPFTAYYEEKGCTYNRRKTCIECISKKQAVARAGRGKEYDRNAKWLRNFGITPEMFAEMFEAQGGACGICRRTDPGGVRNWHIDHDHACCPQPGRSCGECVRGVLCHRCNLMLGHAQDNPSTLLAGAEYLERHGAG